MTMVHAYMTSVRCRRCECLRQVSHVVATPSQLVSQSALHADYTLSSRFQLRCRC